MSTDTLSDSDSMRANETRCRDPDHRCSLIRTIAGDRRANVYLGASNNDTGNSELLRRENGRDQMSN